jgi:Tfp pilus assembly protein PilE
MFLVDLMIAVVIVGLVAIVAISFLAAADANRRIRATTPAKR